MRYPDNDQELLCRMAQHDKKAFEAMYQRYWMELYDMVYQRLKNQAQSEDIVQDVFVRLWMRREELNIAFVGLHAVTCTERNWP